MSLHSVNKCVAQRALRVRGSALKSAAHTSAGPGRMRFSRAACNGSATPACPIVMATLDTSLFTAMRSTLDRMKALAGDTFAADVLSALRASLGFMPPPRFLANRQVRNRSSI